jgi:hypothetical protein
MRFAFALLLGALVGLVAFETATATSPGELLPSCLDIVNRARPVSGGDIDIPPSGLSCWHYMAAIQNASVLEDVRGVRLLGICGPPETTLIDYIAFSCGTRVKQRCKRATQQPSQLLLSAKPFRVQPAEHENRCFRRSIIACPERRQERGRWRNQGHRGV